MANDDAMRTIIDIPERDIQGPDALCGREHVSRSEVIRRAVTDYPARHKGEHDAAFGLWRDRGVDGLSYQQERRYEWVAVAI